MTKFITFLVICLCGLVIAAFFMPWISGEGSIAKPIEDATGVIRKVEPSGLLDGVFNLTKGTLDEFTHILTGKDLQQDLSAYQIVKTKRKDIGPVVYLLYVFPGAAALFIILTIAGNWRRIFDLKVFFLSLIVFTLLYLLVNPFSYENMFIELEAQKGYWITLFSFLAIGLLSFIKVFLPRKTKK